ncbi:prepilin peptidase [Anoxybacillus sediminis]|nr:prepilin peptidase [Anoxybacillus sediminis]
MEMWGAIGAGVLGTAAGWYVCGLACRFGPSAFRAPALFCRLVVSLLCGTLFAVVRMQDGRDIAEQLSALLLIVFSLLVSLTDVLFRRIPNAVLLAALPVLSALHWLKHPDAWLSSLLAGGFGLLLFGTISAVRPDVVGMGDAKLAGVLAAAVGWRTFAAGLTVGSALALAAGVLMLLDGQARRGASLPFAPFLCAGILAVHMLS